MAMTKGESVFVIDTINYCYNTEYTDPCRPDGTMKMYCPKIMSEIGFGSPTTSETKLSDKIFINDDECKPHVGSSLTLQNWVSPKLMYNHCDWQHILDDVYKVPLHTKFFCEFVNHNLRRMKFSTDRV